MAALPSDAASAPPDRGATAPDAAATAIADRNVAQLTRGIWLRSITGLLLIAILATANFLILHDVLRARIEKLGLKTYAQAVDTADGRRVRVRLGPFASRDEAERRVDPAGEPALHRRDPAGCDLFDRGSTALGLPATMSATMNTLYFGEPQHLDRQVRDYVEQLRVLMRRTDQEPGVVRLVAAARDLLGRAAPEAPAPAPDLSALSSREAEVARAILYERIVYGVTLLALLLEAALIYRPLVNRVRRATERLVRQQQFSDRVVDTSQALIIGLDSAGRIALFNQHSQKVTGHAEAEVHGRDFLSTFLPPEAAADPAMEKLFLGGADAGRTETPLRTRDGRLLTVEWSNAELRDPASGRTLLHLATGVDITQRKQA